MFKKGFFTSCFNPQLGFLHLLSFLCFSNSSHKNAFLPGPTSVDPQTVSVATNELTLGAELLVEVLMTFSANAAAAAARDGRVSLDLA